MDALHAGGSGVGEPPDDAEEILSHAAHLLWARRMRWEGWRYGDAYDAQRKVHDALVPFAQLQARDRRQLRIMLEAEEFADRVARLVDYPRGAARPFTVPEMRINRDVALVGQPGQIGKVESWTVGRDGELERIWVRWPDGLLIGYDPQEQVLTRCEEQQ